jgi:hypothetical protein
MKKQQQVCTANALYLLADLLTNVRRKWSRSVRALQATASVIASGVANMLLPYTQIALRTSPPASHAV